MRKTRFFFFFITILVNPLSAQSQKLPNGVFFDFHIEHYTDEDGLSQNSVLSIGEDELGFIWLSTERGLARFDGKNFKIFDNFGKTYPSASIRSFHIDPRPKATGFFAMNSDQNFIHIYQGRAVLDTVLYRQLKDQPFPYPKKGTGYVSERAPTVYYGDPFPNHFVIPAGNDRFFVYDARNLYYYDRKKKIGRFDCGNKRIWDFFRLDNSLYHLEKGKLTRFSAGSGILTGEQVLFRGELLYDRSYKQGKPLQVFWNNATNQTFIVAGKALYRITSETNGDLTSELILQDFDFQKEKIMSVYFDQSAGRIFLGSHISGFWVLTRNKFFPVAGNFPTTDQVYYGQALIGTNGVVSSQGIVYSMDERTKKIAARQLPLVTETVFWDKSSILVDGEGYIWCKRGEKLTVIEPSGSKIKFSWTLPSGITQLYQGIDKTIWIGTWKGGLFYLKPPFSNLKAPVMFLKGALTNISWIGERGDSIWVGTEQGLYRVSRKTKGVSAIKGLEGIYIRNLHMSRDATELWITTYKDGIFLLRDGKLTHFPLDRKGYLANAHCIVEDKKGFFWITTNRGLFQVLKSDLLDYSSKSRELYFHYYSKADGFNTNEFNGGCLPCAVRLPSGFVSLPSIDGLIWFKPELTIAELPDKRIMVDRVEIDGKVVPAGQKQVVFSQNQRQLRLQCSTPFFGNSHNLKFFYALQKADKAPSESDWLGVDVMTGNAATITISTMTKGHYTLHIRKENGFGQDNHSYETIGIDVPPFWYQTWWFYLLIILTLILVSFLYSKYRIRSIEQRNRLLEMQVMERTSQLQIAQDELLGQLHFQSRLMASIAHDVRSPLGAAIIVSDEVQKMIERQQYDMASVFAKNIAEAIRKVKGSLEDLLAYVKIQVYKRELNVEKVNLYDLVEDNIKLYGNTTKINSNTFLNMIPADSFVKTNTQLLKIIIQNLMDNANKFTDAGQIKAYTSQFENLQRLIIEDSGRGISQELLEWFANGKVLPAESQGGIGLTIVKELAPSVCESIRIERLVKGTRVTITFHRTV